MLTGVILTFSASRRLLDSVDYWGPWSSFSSCSTTCGPGYIARSRNCYSQTNHHPQCLGVDKDLRTCNLGQCPAQNACADTIDYCHDYYVDVCTDDQYKYWAYNTCPKYCGFCHEQTTAAPTPLASRVNGGWTTWSSFSSCSKTCGGGSMFRYRQCSNPAPSNGGNSCVGNTTESYGCFIRPCPSSQAPYTAWGSWSNFSSCSVTCGLGEKVRERYRYCTDQSQCKLIGYDRAPCTTQPCPVDGQWSRWNDWSSCSVSCDLGVITRNRSCDNPRPTNGGANCTENNTDIRECTMGQCPDHDSYDSHWGSWSKYSSCSSTCGQGYTARYRSCSSSSHHHSYCDGEEKQLKPCNLGPCHGHYGYKGECVDATSHCHSYGLRACKDDQFIYWAYGTCPKYCGLCPATTTLATTTVISGVDGGWTTWSSFTTCSATCGGGSMFRYRQCSNPAPYNGGNSCVGNNTESYGCFIRPCPTSAAPYTAWGTWTNFSSCSVTCGTGEKVRERYRYCTDKSQCKLTGYDRALCVTQSCPVNGQWNSWNNWSSCSVTCDLGVITRNRSCDNPAPINDGAYCAGNNTESRECTMEQCPTWSHWFETECSATCGSGTKERLRHCSTGRDVDCTGLAFEIVPCKEAPCLWQI